MEGARLRMEETAPRYGGELGIYLKSSGGQPTRDCPPAWGLGEELTTRKKKFVTKYYTGPLKRGAF